MRIAEQRIGLISAEAFGPFPAERFEATNRRLPPSIAERLLMLVWERASQAQRLVLQALALEPTTRLTAAEYRNRHGVGAPSTIARAVEALVEQEPLRRLAPGS